MKLADLKRVTGDSQKRTIALTDTKGREDYELAIRGPAALVARVFEKSDFQIEIDPAATVKTAQTRLRALTEKYSSPAKTPFPDPGENAFKRPSTTFNQKNAIVVSLRRIRGQGTFWAFGVPPIALPRGINLLFILPPVSFCVGVVRPFIGDADLFLTLNGTFTPTVAMSILGGTAVDVVSFGLTAGAPSLFVPFFRVNAFTTCLTDFFMAGFA